MPDFDIRDFGARGNGVAVDSPAIQRAIDAAAKRGGGVVLLPAGRYLSFSIRLHSHVALRFAPGAVLIAADSQRDHGRYDDPEPNPFDLYQDFGHSHWHNSLIWGDGVEDVTISGPGRIDGLGLTRESPPARWTAQRGHLPLSMQGMSAEQVARLEPDLAAMRGRGNKAIALKNSRNVSVRDLTIYKAGHFALLATGVEQLTIENLRIDTDRDGIDLDSVRDVQVLNSWVNTPNDDAIVVKSSYALGMARTSENVTIRGCHVSGYDLGTLLDGTRATTQKLAPDQDGPTGRIKLGTESNGGFRNIIISDSTFTHSRGLAIETVDGGTIDNVVASNLVMHDVTTAPIFIRLGNRGRGPDGTPIASLRHVVLSNIVADDVDPRYAATIAGLPGHPVEDVSLSHIRITHRGGIGAASAQAPPEHAGAYPEPSMFGISPAQGLYARHVRGLHLDDVVIDAVRPDARTALQFDDVANLSLADVSANGGGGLFALLEHVRDFSLRDSAGHAALHFTSVRHARIEPAHAS
ncbi:glycoside hydrolase family 28 protein [Solimonas sp. C16B3]|uniref:Glycoside hydrolase family 28 protein n=2 Tax=Solimonas marina TaxID=2714601 RepID=A0A969WCN6_9GAMM|nr:glycoside hydrolase family 28 protein [Solimonas marina]